LLVADEVRRSDRLDPRIGIPRQPAEVAFLRRLKAPSFVLGAGLEACRITGIFWFGALPRNGLQNIWQKIKSRFTPIMPGLCAVHKKIIPRDQFGYRFGISSNHLVKNIPSASVVSATRKPERLNSSRIPESCVQEIE
jgi:hypothetical protein